MSDDQPAESASQFDLVTHDGNARFRLRLADHGVALEDDALLLRRSGRWTRAPYDRIASITLNSGSVGRSGTIANCAIQLVNGSRIVLSNINDRGLPDGSHDGPFRLFVTEFHHKLIATGAAKSIRFVTGYSAGRINGLVVISIIAGLFFVVLPLVLLAMTGELKLLLALLFGAGLVWPLSHLIRTNQPGTYQPSRPPDFLE